MEGAQRILRAAKLASKLEFCDQYARVRERLFGLVFFASARRVDNHQAWFLDWFCLWSLRRGSPTS